MVEQQTKLLAFDRQNHMGASDTIANSISQAIKAEAEEMLNEKKVVASALNIQESANRMKVGFLDCISAHGELQAPFGLKLCLDYCRR